MISAEECRKHTEQFERKLLDTVLGRFNGSLEAYAKAHIDPFFSLGDSDLEQPLQEDYRELNPIIATLSEFVMDDDFGRLATKLMKEFEELGYSGCFSFVCPRKGDTDLAYVRDIRIYFYFDWSGASIPKEKAISSEKVAKTIYFGKWSEQ